MPTAEAVVALVNQGWSYGEVMAMPAREFGFWLEQQNDLNKLREEASKRASAKAR